MTPSTRLALPVAVTFFLCAGLAASAPAPAPDPAVTRAEMAEESYKVVAAMFPFGTVTVESIAQWSLRWAEAKKDWAGHANRMRELVKRTTDRRALGERTPLEVMTAKYFLADAELRAAGK